MKLFDDDPLAAQAERLVDRLPCPNERAFRRAECVQPGHTEAQDRSQFAVVAFAAGAHRRAFVRPDDTLDIAPAAS